MFAILEFCHLNIFVNLIIINGYANKYSYITDQNKEVHRLERIWRRNKSNKTAHVNFQQAQRIFDKSVTRCKRRWNRAQAMDLEKINTKDLEEFWQAIKKMGRNKHHFWNTEESSNPNLGWVVHCTNNILSFVLSLYVCML